MLLFLNISGGEVVVVFLVVLMLFGPQSIPSIARGLGRGIRAIKDAAGDLQKEIRDSADRAQQETDLKQSLDITKEIDISSQIDLGKDIEDPLRRS